MLLFRLKYDDNPNYALRLSDQLRLRVQHGEKKESIREKKLKQLK